MSLNADSPVVRLCIEGVACENDHRFEDALCLYMQAWRQSSDDFERCIAAHYVARHQKSTADALRWNLEALNCANAVRDDRARAFFSSLYLNVGKSYEEAGDRPRAAEFFRCAADKLWDIPAGSYRELLTDGIERALLRVSADQGGINP